MYGGNNLQNISIPADEPVEQETDDYRMCVRQIKKEKDEELRECENILDWLKSGKDSVHKSDLATVETQRKKYGVSEQDCPTRAFQ